LQPDGRTIVREGAALLTSDGAKAGVVTSGGFSPTLERPIAVGYVAAGVLRSGLPLSTQVRGREVCLQIARLPFVPHCYHRTKP
jgi:aminomethyltransferase